MAALQNIEQLFIEWGGLIRNNVAKNIVTSDFYLKYLPKDKWVDGQGTQVSYPIYERSLSSSATTTPGGVTFSNWTSSGGDGNDATKTGTYAASPTNSNLDSGAATGPLNRTGTLGGGSYVVGQKIDSFGITVRTMSLKKAALNSPDISLDDLQFAWQVEDQVKNVVRVLSENTKYVWTNTYQDEYIDACRYKSVARCTTTGYDPTTTSFGTTAPNSVLTWGVLEAIYEQLGYEGGSLNPHKRVDETTPIYAVVGERFTFNDLKKQDANVRDDFRYAYMGTTGDANPMLSAPGLNSILRGFQFYTVELPPRYDLVAGAWVRRYPYAPSNTSRGVMWNISAEYKNAQYTDTVIYHQDVMKILTPLPRTSQGGGMTYNPAYSWAGEFVWRNIPDRESNIDGSTGFFRALYAYGAKIERPELGFVVRHIRCVNRAKDMLDCDGDPACPTP
jgi:hypothetical protein